MYDDDYVFLDEAENFSDMFVTYDTQVRMYGSQKAAGYLTFTTLWV